MVLVVIRIEKKRLVFEKFLRYPEAIWWAKRELENGHEVYVTDLKLHKAA